MAPAKKAEMANAKCPRCGDPFKWRRSLTWPWKDHEQKPPRACPACLLEIAAEKHERAAAKLRKKAAWRRLRAAWRRLA
jgi:endogenous inhibitor of DNA gyrase (YacG/DUF329 family)